MGKQILTCKLPFGLADCANIGPQKIRQLTKEAMSVVFFTVEIFTKLSIYGITSKKCTEEKKASGT